MDPEFLAATKVAGAALCGGIVRMFLRPARDLRQTVLLLLCCIICGGFATPIVMDVWQLPDHWAGAMGAALGFVGLSVAQAVLKGLDHLNLGSFFQRRVE